MGFQRLPMSKEFKLKAFLYANTSLCLGVFFFFFFSHFFESKSTMGHQLFQFTYEYPEFTFHLQLFQSPGGTCQHLSSGVKWESADFSRQGALQKLGVYTISEKIGNLFSRYVFIPK